MSPVKFTVISTNVTAATGGFRLRKDVRFNLIVEVIKCYLDTAGNKSTS